MALTEAFDHIPNQQACGWQHMKFLELSFPWQTLADELTRAVLEVQDKAVDERMDVPQTFNDLVEDITANQHDIKTFVLKTKAMLAKLDRKVQTAKLQESIHRHFASLGIPKGIHCLSLRLADEYSVNAAARSPLPSLESVHTLTDNSFHHFVLVTDNVLAASVVVSSAVRNSRLPEKIVFHVVTDKKSFAPIHAWFALNSLSPAVVEVKGLHQFDLPLETNELVLEIFEFHCAIREFHYRDRAGEHDYDSGALAGKIYAGNPNHVSILKYLRIFLPQLFPELNKIVFLDDDLVVLHDLTPLWAVDLKGKVNGAVETRSRESVGDVHFPTKYRDYLNFSNQIVSSRFDPDRPAWTFGMNIFDLEAWRRTNITQTYHHWLKLNLDSGLTLWRDQGTLPPALIAFDRHMQAIDDRWHMSGMGYEWPELDWEKLEAASVVHYSGPAKPWLQVGSQELRGMWTRHVNFSNEIVRKCQIME